MALVYTFSNPRHSKAVEFMPPNEHLIYNLGSKKLGQHSARLPYREPIPNYSTPPPVKELYKQDAIIMKEQPKSNYNEHYNKFNGMSARNNQISIPKPISQSKEYSLSFLSSEAKTPATANATPSEAETKQTPLEMVQALLEATDKTDTGTRTYYKEIIRS